MDNSSSLDPKEAKILVVDDDIAVRLAISRALQRVGYQVSDAESGEQALELMEDQTFDVVLTDIRMSGLTGVDLLAKIKEKSPDAIVILMTAFASLGSAVDSLRLGAHDYLLKPLSNQDIRQSVARGLERAYNLRRRRTLLDTIRSNIQELTDKEQQPAPRPAPVSNSLAASAPVMTIGPLTIIPGHYRIQVGEKSINLTPTEFDLLLYLAAHRGRIVPCAELVREVRGYTVEESEAREVIRPHISNLRGKLSQAGKEADLIDNVRGVGYRLSEPNSN